MGKNLKEISRTFMVLIPKGENFRSIEDFRLVFLCNTTYKIITKMLSNKLKDIIPRIVFPPHFNIIKGRAMLDAIMI